MCFVMLLILLKVMEQHHISLPVTRRNEMLYWVGTVEDRCRTDLTEDARVRKKEKTKVRARNQRLTKYVGFASPFFDHLVPYLITMSVKPLPSGMGI